MEVIITYGIFSSDSLDESQEMTNDLWFISSITFIPDSSLSNICSGSYHEKSEFYTDFPQMTLGIPQFQKVKYLQ